MNVKMWLQALKIIPRITKAEWEELDVISKWLISTRAVVLVMTFLSAAFAGIFAYRAGQYNWGLWALVAFGLVMSHATNNLLNDYTDYVKGVDQDNYYRAQYGPQPLVHGLWTKRQLLTYAAVTGLIALASGVALVAIRGGNTILFLTAGIFFVLFYTWPLKYIALGEIAVLLVWGPLMIGGGYYVITGSWDWNVIIGSLPYALGVTGVIFGKHIDKYQVDKERRIHTLPVVIGERNARFVLVAILIFQYIIVAYLMITGFFSPLLLIIFLTIPTLYQIFPMFRSPKPDQKPADFPDVWPNYFVAAGFQHNRVFGLWFFLGLVLDTILKKFILS